MALYLTSWQLQPRLIVKIDKCKCPLCRKQFHDAYLEIGLVLLSLYQVWLHLFNTHVMIFQKYNKYDE